MNLLNDPRIQAFLEASCQKILSRKARKEVREELLSHLEESVATKIDTGVSEHDAISQAIAEIGPPIEIAHDLAIAHRPLYFHWPFLVTISAMSGVIAILAASHITTVSINNVIRTNQEIISAFQDRFLQDQRALSSEPFFQFSGTKRDAGIVMNQQIAWEDSNRFIDQDKPIESALALPEAIRKQLHRSPSWLEVKIDVSRYNTSWISNLAAYDHWDLFKNGPLKQYLDRNPNAGFWTLPVPDYALLQDWAKLRILKGFREKKVVLALQETRHLAQLIYSNELLISDMVAVAMLRAERNAYEYAVSKNYLSRSDWTPMSEEILIRAKRSMFAYKQFLNPWTETNLLHQLFDGKLAVAGMCSAFMEAAPNLIIHRSFLSSPLPWEENLSEKFDQLDSIIDRTRSHCRMSAHFLRLWREPKHARAWFKPSNFNLLQIRWHDVLFNYLTYVPFLRLWALSEFFNYSNPNYFTGPYKTNLLPNEKTKN